VRQLILEYKLAEKAQQIAERPKVKGLARQIMMDNRDALSRLLAAADGKPIAGVEQRELDQMVKSTGSNQQSGKKDKRFTGNTATDSLGSGKTGSGNVEGEDTSTLAASKSYDGNGNYSEGEYLNNSESFQIDLQLVNNSSGKQFERQWLDLMDKLQQRKIIMYNRAIDISKDEDVRAAALSALPRAKIALETIIRVRTKKGPAESTDPNTQKRAGDDNINRKNADR
jgi:hypothetical protein